MLVRIVTDLPGWASDAKWLASKKLAIPACRREPKKKLPSKRNALEFEPTRTE
jgi:hypothetical protein